MANAEERARRHSRLVSVLRLALPISAALLVAFYALTFGISRKVGSGRLNVGELRVSVEDLMMKGPSYFGVTKDGGRYEVRASHAVVAFNRDAPIKLIDIDGDLVQINNVVTKLKAKHGLFDNAKSELELFDGIDINGSNGLQAKLSRAMVYTKEHRIVSKHPVDVLMPTGTVRGDTMTMRTDTKEATFVGDVKVHLLPAQQQDNGPGAVSPAFGRDSRQPLFVASDQLYVNDTTKTSIFTGSVVAVQGDSTLRTPEMHVAYEGKAAAEMAMSVPQQPGEGSRLSKLVAKNGAMITIGTDRRVVGDEAEFDAKADTALFTGNVVVTQLKNVLQGRRLFVDRKAGKSRLEFPVGPGQPIGRIAATFYQAENSAGAQPKPNSATGDTTAAAQGSVFGSIRPDPNAPIEVEADTLDMDDQVKQAIFRGNVKSQQGDFVVRTFEMAVFYTGQGSFTLAGRGDDPANKSSSQLTHVEARQKVLIASKDGQTASGDWAIFDLKANSVLLGDHVVVSRDKDVAEGPRLMIDLTTGMYRFELEQEAAPAQVPAISASPQPGAGAPAALACPPGKQCLLFYPKDAQDKAGNAVKKGQ